MLHIQSMREDLLGALVPCAFQEITAPSSNQPTPNQTGIVNDIRYQPAAQSVDLNYNAAGSGQAHGYSDQEQAFNRKPDQGPPAISHQITSTIVELLMHSLSRNNIRSIITLTSWVGISLKISRLREGLGVATNNVAEYRGLILGLKYAIRHGFKRIKVYGDSQLVCYQVKGTWQAKKENMMELCNEVRKLQENFIYFEVNHVRREWNAEADRQANIALTLASGAISEERGDGL